jgi:hypothetical protein
VVNHFENVLVARFGSGGHRKAGTKLVPPVAKLLEPELGQLLGQGGHLVAHDGRHGYSLAPVQGLPLGQCSVRLQCQTRTAISRWTLPSDQGWWAHQDFKKKF